MKNRIKNIELIKRNVKRGLRFKSGKQCYKVVDIYPESIRVFTQGIKNEISREQFYHILNNENSNVIHSWRAYEEIIGN